MVGSHVRSYETPIVLQSGDRVAVGRRDSEWTSWLWCTDASGVSGWVPEAVLAIQGDGAATVGQDYSSMELTVRAGQRVVGFKHIDGWVWCRNEQNEEGWIPSSVLAGS